jgi:hypothetical protein
MHLLRHRERPTEPFWAVASATQIFLADPATVASLASATYVGQHDAAPDGILTATRHPTGWFVHGVRLDDLPAEQIRLFRELVTVRTYLLLAHGPEAPAWLPSTVPGEWLSLSLSIARELSELDKTLVE